MHAFKPKTAAICFVTAICIIVTCVLAKEVHVRFLKPVAIRDKEKEYSTTPVGI
jgi:hypothetical protein